MEKGAQLLERFEAVVRVVSEGRQQVLEVDCRGYLKIHLHNRMLSSLPEEVVVLLQPVVPIVSVGMVEGQMAEMVFLYLVE